jgi:hypothetical protein
LRLPDTDATLNTRSSKTSGVEATVRIGDPGARWLALLFVALSMTGCRPDDAHPRISKLGIAVALVLLPDRSNGCCVVVSMNDEGRSIHALCEVTAFDPDGRLIFAGLVPGPPPGGRRSPFAGGMSGLLAPPGRHVYGRVDLPVDLTRDTYRSKCRVAIWHGAPPL